MPFTFHTHSGQQQVGKGMHTIGLTEHIPRCRPQDPTLRQPFPHTSQKPKRLQTKYQDRIKIVIGCETEYITQLDMDRAKQVQEEFGLDYIVGSMYEQIVAKYNGDRTAVFRRYFELQYQMLQALQPTVVGHFDLVRIFHPRDQPDPLLADEAVRRLAVRNIEYIVSYGGVVERDLLREILARRGRITLSDDSHGGSDVAMHYDRLYAYLMEMQVQDVHCVGTGGRIEVFAGAMQDGFWAKNGFCE
ncbi:histidinol phosphate phosphatase H [Linderina pennispora]|uniref:Histidinol-phosphatase n=1 Tax=Linderina pennispora TaxID=61395 RepID=A0A1Y1WKP6_9FUNG|nr:histidinol phosphate phosphatase H [Linderina pennispora]ORX74151.1 histidinol phosphate phosphatase H [Linderina pennispora]